MTTKSLAIGSALLVSAIGASVFAASGQTPCIDAAGSIVWTRTTCPPGTTPVPDACEEGWCVECPPEGCPETVEALMCCGAWSGEDQGCFGIVETTNECPPGHDIVWCENGVTNSDGSETCFPP